MINTENSILMIIDVQEKLLNAVYNKEELFKKAEIMAKSAEILDIPVIVTEQYPKGLGKTVIPVNTSNIFEKTSFSALDVPELQDLLNSYSRKQIILFGIETHICVSQTAYALTNSGYEVCVISDASGSRTEAEHIAGLERLRFHNAQIATAEIAIFEWLKTAKHPRFKEVQALIK